jgi:hypothetical protein
MNNITLVKVMDDNVMAFIPKYIDNSIIFNSNPFYYPAGLQDQGPLQTRMNM